MEEDDELARIRARLLAELAARDPAPAPAAQPAWPDAPVEVTDATFHETVRRFPLALVDFWAPWCGPCRLVAPIVDELAREMRGRVAFLKLNTDVSPATATSFGVQSIPTLIVFKDGRPVDRLVGALPKPHLVAALRRHLGERRGTPGPRRL